MQRTRTMRTPSFRKLHVKMSSAVNVWMQQRDMKELRYRFTIYIPRLCILHVCGEGQGVLDPPPPIIFGYPLSKIQIFPSCPSDPYPRPFFAKSLAPTWHQNLVTMQAQISKLSNVFSQGVGAKSLYEPMLKHCSLITPRRNHMEPQLPLSLIS